MAQLTATKVATTYTLTLTEEEAGALRTILDRHFNHNALDHLGLHSVAMALHQSGVSKRETALYSHAGWSPPVLCH